MRLKVSRYFGKVLPLFVLLVACSQERESFFSSMLAANSGIDTNIRWLLPSLPESSSNFRQIVDFTSGFAQVTFSFDAGFKGQLHESCTKIASYDYFPPPPLKAAWWNETDFRSENEVFRCGKGESTLFLAMSRKSGKGYLWSLGHG
jgi:hypothetical protein